FPGIKPDPALLVADGPEGLPWTWNRLHITKCACGNNVWHSGISDSPVLYHTASNGFRTPCRMGGKCRNGLEPSGKLDSGPGRVLLPTRGVVCGSVCR